MSADEAEAASRTITNLKKRRGVVRSSLTKLITKTGEIESSESSLRRERAEQALAKLGSLDKEYYLISSMRKKIY